MKATGARPIPMLRVEMTSRNAFTLDHRKLVIGRQRQLMPVQLDLGVLELLGSQCVAVG
jgi:hypothetical protein